MSKPHGIAWLNMPDYKGESWNPITGCTPVSEGCANCYAMAMAKRLQAMGSPNYKNGFDVAFHPEVLNKVAHWKKPRFVFACSMSDLFHEIAAIYESGELDQEATVKKFLTVQQEGSREVREDVQSKYVDEILDCISSVDSPHIFIALTKRPNLMKFYLDDYYEIEGMDVPYSNLWLGVSVENQERADERIPILLETPAAMRVVSVEPMLGPVDLQGYLACRGCGYTPRDMEIQGDHSLCENPFPILDWVIVGCESGPKRRPCKIEWVESIVEQCKFSRIPCFVKQIDLGGRVSHNMNEWPESLRVQQWPEMR